ncbi:ATP-binding protein [Streptomyces sp. NBC_01381]|uniref:ATP-binding protein n=1 Tax=Streptomyces sp. NBC_01381 TaxID=2903845 RepID=UPI00225B89CF|nr:ATP-binding protein [Streptomyces sp. NBC_01381]MCX4665261.1 ATP-binding protein [Streptomyces sp. NBC_01381]
MKAQISTPISDFTQRLSSTRRGARLARRLAAHQLDLWGIPHGSELSDAAAHVVAELAANAVTHGHVPGRDFELRLVYAESARTLRIEVSDARGDRVPELRPPDPGAETGRGLRLVEAAAATWGVRERRIGKTVWAELRVRPRD